MNNIQSQKLDLFRNIHWWNIESIAETYFIDVELSVIECFLGHKSALD